MTDPTSDPTPEPIDPSNGESAPSATRAPGRPGMTRERFDDAWSALSERGAGREPTLRELRRYLGSGSLSTLSRYRRLRTREAHQRDQQPAAQSPDAALLETVTSLVDSLAAEAADAADTRISDHRKEADARVKRAELISEKTQQDTALHQQRADNAEAERTRVQQQLEQAQQALTEAQQAQISAAERCATALTEQESMSQRLAELDAQQLAQQSRDDQREREWQEKQNALANTVSEQKQQLTQQRHDLSDAQRNAQSLQQSLRSTEKRLEQQQQQAIELSTELAGKQHDLQQINIALLECQQNAQHQRAKDEQQIAMVTEQLAHEREHTAQLTHQIASQQSLLEQLQHMNQQLTHVQHAIDKQSDAGDSSKHDKHS